MASCECGNNFFIEHENSSVVIQEDIHEVLNSGSLNGYKIIECVFCRKLYIMRQYQRGRAETIIPIQNFGAEDAKKFLERNNARGTQKFPLEVLNQMVMKR